MSCHFFSSKAIVESLARENAGSRTRRNKRMEERIKVEDAIHLLELSHF